MCYMERIGVRELRQHASRYLARVREGETIEVTSRGQPIARLAPIVPDEGLLERLVAEGKVRPAKGRLADLGPPLRRASDRPLSAVLDEQRAERPLA